MMAVTSNPARVPAASARRPPGIGPTGPSAGLASGPDRPAAPAWGLERGHTL